MPWGIRKAGRVANRLQILPDHRILHCVQQLLLTILQSLPDRKLG